MVAKHPLLYASYETKIVKICIVLFDCKTGVHKISRARWQSNSMSFEFFFWLGSCI